jgi:predicted Rossmann fold flavoprotein
VRIERIEAADGIVTGVQAGGSVYTATSYVLATGGLSHPETGSTGDGFAWLKELGHTVIEPTPTIVPLKVSDAWVKKLSGKSAEGKITFFADGKKKFARKGTILFTHFGMSGPTILNAAGSVADLMQEGAVTATLDLFPAEDLGNLDARITQLFDGTKNKLLRNACRELLPPGTTDVLLSLIPQVDPETKVHSVRKEERRSLATLFKNLPITITGLMGFERAVVADGGVPVSEVDMRTMRSKKITNLFLVGDILHITRPSGGYSLQLCWTTGYIAGTNA